MPRIKLTKQEVDELIELRKSKWSYIQLARKFKIHHTSALYWVRTLAPELIGVKVKFKKIIPRKKRKKTKIEKILPKKRKKAQVVAFKKLKEERRIAKAIKKEEERLAVIRKKEGIISMFENHIKNWFEGDGEWRKQQKGIMLNLDHNESVYAVRTPFARIIGKEKDFDLFRELLIKYIEKNGLSSIQRSNESQGS